MIFLLHGPNVHAKKRIFEKIRAAHAQRQMYLLDCFDIKQVTLAVLDALTSQISLFEEKKKLIYVKDYLFFENQTFIEKLAQRFEKSVDMLIVLETNQTIRKNMRILKFIPAERVNMCEHYTDGQLEKLILDQLKQYNIQDAKQICLYLMDKVEHNPFYLEHEIDKIALLKQPAKLEQIKEITSVSIHATIWEYIQCITNGNAYKAVRIVVDLLDKGENEYGIIGMILWNVRLMSVVKAAEGRSDLAIVKAFGYSPYSIKHVRTVLNRFPFAKITTLYQKIIELDLRIKTGVIEPRLGIILISLAF